MSFPTIDTPALFGGVERLTEKPRLLGEEVRGPTQKASFGIWLAHTFQEI